MRARQLPHNRQAELAVLCGVLLRNDLMDDIADILVASSFYIPAHAAVWRAMERLSEHGEPIDPVTLERQLRASDELGLVGGLEGIGKIADGYATSSNAVRHARIVERVAAQRRMVETALAIVAEGYETIEDIDGWIDDAQRRVMESGATQERTNYKHINTTLHGECEAVFNQAQAAAKAKETGEPIPLLGLRTGYYQLDEMTQGLQPADLIVLAARPSMGKTALAMNIATAVAKDGEPVLVFSMEMSRQSMTRRALFSESRVEGKRFMKGAILEDDSERLINGAKRIYKMPIAIDDRGGLGINALRREARRWRKDPLFFPRAEEVKEEKTGLILVDYLQLGTGDGKAERRDLEVGQISKGLKNLAKELQLPVLALSQLNRGVDARPDHRPRLSDLRESGNIEQDADIIAFLYREARYLPDGDPEKEKKERDAELIIGKQRNGEIGTVFLRWIGEHTRFENPAREEYR